MEIFTPLISNQIEMEQNDIDRLTNYIKALEKWNNIHALTSVSARELPYVFIVEPIVAARELVKTVNPLKCIDIGTGFGNPGIAMSVYFKKADFLLLDASQKKTALLRKIVYDEKFERVKVVTARIEDVTKQIDSSFDLVISRGIGSLDKTLEYAYELAKLDGTIAIFKAKLDVKEFSDIKKEGLVLDRVLTLNVVYPLREVARYVLVYKKVVL
jgi:16S rRNA (guanine527-N7)-methyltransferase